MTKIFIKDDKYIIAERVEDFLEQSNAFRVDLIHRELCEVTDKFDVDQSKHLVMDYSEEWGDGELYTEMCKDAITHAHHIGWSVYSAKKIS